MWIIGARILRVRLPGGSDDGSLSLEAPEAARTVVALFGSDGSIGLGETSGTYPAYRAAQAACRALAGFAAHNYRTAYDLLYRATGGEEGVQAAGAAEAAVWDLAARHLGAPLQALLPAAQVLSGGAGIRLSASTLDGLVSAAAAHRAATGSGGDRGRPVIVKPPEGDCVDAALVERIGAALGGSPNLAVDCGGRLDSAGGDEALVELAGLGVELLIDPVLELQKLAALRSKLPIPVAAYRTIRGARDIALAIRLEAADVILGNVASWGGIAPFLSAAALCQAFELEMGLLADHSVGISLALDRLLAEAEPAVNRGLFVQASQGTQTLLAECDPRPQASVGRSGRGHTLAVDQLRPYVIDACAIGERPAEDQP